MSTIKVNKNIHKYSIGLLNDTIDLEIFCGGKDCGVVLVPPDPNWGGSKNTKVIDDIFWQLVDNNISCLRFSFTRYPIVNHNYDRYIAQASLCVEEFIEVAKLPNNFFILGYSFGATIALNILLRRPEIKAGILIAPPVNYYHMVSWLSPYKTKVALYYGEQDEITPKYIYDEYIEILKSNHIEIIEQMFPDVNHYFHNNTKILTKTVLQFLQQNTKNSKLTTKKKKS